MHSKEKYEHLQKNCISQGQKQRMGKDPETSWPICRNGRPRCALKNLIIAFIEDWGPQIKRGLSRCSDEARKNLVPVHR